MKHSHPRAVGGDAARHEDNASPGEREILHEGKFVRLVKQGRWEFAERTNCRDAVCIVAVTPEHALLLVEQLRPAVGAPVIELPAGLVADMDPGEDYATAAMRELEEETGYSAAAMHALFGGPPSAGLAAERIYLYRAKGLRRVGDGGGDDSERISVHAVALTNLESWLGERAAAGDLVDPKIYAALFALRDELPR